MSALPSQCFPDSSTLDKSTTDKKPTRHGRCGFRFFKIEENNDQKIHLSYVPYSRKEVFHIAISKQTYSNKADAAEFIKEQQLPVGGMDIVLLLAMAGASDNPDVRRAISFNFPPTPTRASSSGIWAWSADENNDIELIWNGRKPNVAKDSFSVDEIVKEFGTKPELPMICCTPPFK